MHRLDGKTALVTGGGRGIGRAVARRLAQEGAEVVIHFGSNREAAEETAAQIRRLGGSATVIRARFAEGEPAEAASALWAAFDEVHDRVDVLVNSAGAASSRGTIEQVTPAELQGLLAVNAIAPFFVTQQALPRLRDGGRIINVSAHLTRGAWQPDLVAYAMSKATIDALTATLAKQLGPRGITVNAVAPGVVDTDMNSAWLHAARELVAGLSPLGRVAEPEDIADVIAFLATDDARWITGQRVDTSGGALL